MVPLRRFRPYVAWVVFFCALIVLLRASYSIREVQAVNHAIADGSLLTQQAPSRDPRVRYAIGWLHADHGSFRDAARHFAEAEASADLQLSAQAKLALGNLYFELGMAAGDIAAGGSHQQGAAQMELAREAYRGALRLVPDLHAARYNLELLERVGPQRRMQGWTRETDGVTLQAFKRDGWAQMKDNPKRGLP